LAGSSSSSDIAALRRVDARFVAAIARGAGATGTGVTAMDGAGTGTDGSGV